MQCLTLRADGALLEQIAILAQNLAHKEGKEISICLSEDERYKNYESDFEKIKLGKLKTYSIDELQERIARWR